jgi:hypothetical protein
VMMLRLQQQRLHLHHAGVPRAVRPHP